MGQVHLPRGRARWWEERTSSWHHRSSWHAGEESGNEDDVLMHSFAKPTSPALLVWPLHPLLFPRQQARAPLRTHAKDAAEKGSRPKVK